MRDLEGLLDSTGKSNGPIVYSYRLLPGAEEAIYDRISDITISMKSADHLKMPELVNSSFLVHMDKKEFLKYVHMKQDLLLHLPKGEVTAANAAALSGKLVQMANGAVYADDGRIEEIHNRKLDALEDIIESANENQCLLLTGISMIWNVLYKDLRKRKLTFAGLIRMPVSEDGMRVQSRLG